MLISSRIEKMIKQWYSGHSAIAGMIGLFLAATLAACGSGDQIRIGDDVQQASSRQDDAPAVTVRDEVPEGGLETFEERIPATTVTYEMIRVPGGSIVMETPDGPEEIEIEPFDLGRTEVTWNEYDIFAFNLDAVPLPDGVDADAVMEPSRPYGSPDFGFGRQGYAAIAMNFVGANAYAEWLSIVTGESYRIPTEAEWEYACRAGLLDSELPGEDDLEEYAWFWDNAFDSTHPVGSLEANPWGFHDMLGNAAEWCLGMDGEWYVCGGSFRDRQEDVHCGARAEQTDRWQMTDPQMPKSLWWLSDGPFVGFRILREP